MCAGFIVIFTFIDELKVNFELNFAHKFRKLGDVSPDCDLRLKRQCVKPRPYHFYGQHTLNQKQDYEKIAFKKKDTIIPKSVSLYLLRYGFPHTAPVKKTRCL